MSLQRYFDDELLKILNFDCLHQSWTFSFSEQRQEVRSWPCRASHPRCAGVPEVSVSAEQHHKDRANQQLHNDAEELLRQFLEKVLQPRARLPLPPLLQKEAPAGRKD